MKRTREGRREGEKGRGGESYQAKTTSHPRPGSRRSRGNPFNIIFNLALNRLAVSASRVEKLALASLKLLSLSLSAYIRDETRRRGAASVWKYSQLQSSLLIRYLRGNFICGKCGDSGWFARGEESILS